MQLWFSLTCVSRESRRQQRSILVPFLQRIRPGRMCRNVGASLLFRFAELRRPSGLRGFSVDQHLTSNSDVDCQSSQEDCASGAVARHGLDGCFHDSSSGRVQQHLVTRLDASRSPFVQKNTSSGRCRHPDADLVDYFTTHAWRSEPVAEKSECYEDSPAAKIGLLRRCLSCVHLKRVRLLARLGLDPLGT